MNSFYEKTGYSKCSLEEIESNLKGNNRLNIFYNEIVYLLKFKEKLNILDVGCGKGAFTSCLRTRFPNNHYFGDDISIKAISSIENYSNSIIFGLNDYNKKVNHADNKFDLILAGELIEHLWDTDNFFSETRRILKDGGYLVLTTPNLSSWIDRLMLFFGYLPLCLEVSNISRIFGRKIFYKKDSESVGHIRCFTWTAIRDLSKYYKFQIIQHKGAWFINSTINKIITALIPRLSQQQVLVLRKIA